MAKEDTFCKNYMVLHPNEGGVLDMVKLLGSSNMEKNKVVDGPEGMKVHDFKHRWVIFCTILLQKFLALIKRPLAWFGKQLEMWLNLLSNNQNFAVLMLNLIRRKVVWPDRESINFTSTIGHLDKRVALDKNIKHEDHRYHRVLSIMAAKLSYENAAFIKHTVVNNWQMEFVVFDDYWNEYQNLRTTQAFMFLEKTADHKLIVVSFRGTETFDADAWSTDVDMSWYDLPIPNDGKVPEKFMKVHGGFMKALGLVNGQGWPKNIEQEEDRPRAYYTLREKVRDLLEKNDKAKFIVTGHSLGGALAILFPMVLALHGETEILDRLEGIYTFGQPRVGDEKLGEFMKKQLRLHDIKYVRTVYNNDIVPRVPFDNATFLFKHFGTCLFYNSFYIGKIVIEEPNMNYFSLIWMLPKILNALYELMRSFGIYYTRGQDYGETWFLRVFRIIGLLIPGVPAHCPQDYVNATRAEVSDFLAQIKYD
ncbi:hypothetical protein GIB67_016228 [Kingdonia uniflora]|uniref:Fungal lipase-type domain-containing protein n=1 Tax=Kingdonia uniflora TaxID=39325 RepID=A0A7J7LT76_9MAGN|nr:hypothetical protein GIB67_016228 [Kingdonia uniflora]